jgi:two-component system LytT family response regulator
VNTERRIRGIIVDDEPLAREGLRLRLAEEPDFEVIAEYGSGLRAREGIRQLEPDVVFLDIRMPEISGFDVLDASFGSRPAVVFLTAYDDHALRAFAESALDYVLKPASDQRMDITLDRIRSHVATTREAEFGRRVRELAGEAAAPGKADATGGPKKKPATVTTDSRRLDALRVHERGRILLVRAEQVDWIEACGNYVRLHVNGRTHVARYSIAQLERRLAGRFIRIHRSTLVQRDRITEFQPHFHGDYVAVLKDKTVLRVGRTYREGLLHDE